MGGCPFCDKRPAVGRWPLARHLHRLRTMRTRTRSWGLWALTVLLSWLGVSEPAGAGEMASPWGFCASYAGMAEKTHRLPSGLLRAIAKVETGRTRKAEGEVLAWPWTVMAEGKGRYLPSKAAAIAEVEALRARGVKNIDVGCMQINLYYHPKAFDNLEAAFDPATNTEAAARILVAFKDTWGSWTRAVGNYHSNTPVLSGPYRVKVYRTLFKDRRRAAQAESARIRDRRRSIPRIGDKDS